MATTTTQLDGLFKRVYGDKLVDLVPKSAYLQGRLPLEEAKKIGKQFEFPVIVRNEQGATYAAAGDGAFDLNASSSMITQNAEVDGSQIVMRGTLDYESAAKAVAGGPKAFASATKTQVRSLMESTRNRLEIANLYGQSPEGLARTASSSNVSTTVTDVTFDADSFAVGMWAGHEGAQIQFRQVGSLGTLVSSGADSVFTVTAVEPGGTANTLRVTGTTTGIGALDTAIGSNDQAVFFNGAYLKEQVGIDAICQNTGTLFGIDAGTYSLWKANNISDAVAITLEVVNEANSNAVARGLDGEVDVLINPQVWNVVLNDQAALRRYDSGSSTNQWTNGANGLSFESQNGRMNFVPHRFVKPGTVYILPIDCMHRIGAQDVSFEIPGAPGQIFRHLDDKAAYEFRTYSNQAIICDSPAKTTRLFGFTY
jgi:hypothetical protein